MKPTENCIIIIVGGSTKVSKFTETYESKGSLKEYIQAVEVYGNVQGQLHFIRVYNGNQRL